MPVRPTYYPQMYASPPPYMANAPVFPRTWQTVQYTAVIPESAPLYIIFKVRARRILGSTMPHFVLRRATVEHKSCNFRAQNETSRNTKWRIVEHKMRSRGAKGEKTPCNERGGPLQSIFKQKRGMGISPRFEYSHDCAI